MENWYAVQVRAGREEGTAALCRRIIPPGTYEDCFIPRCERERRYQGAWHKEEAVMFPGYLFFITGHVEELYRGCRRVPELTKILGDGEAFIPLYEAEASRLARMMNEKHVTEMSAGYLSGDEIRITEGPMKELAGRIKKLDRHRRTAVVQMELFGRTVDVTLGLEVVRREKAPGPEEGQGHKPGSARQ